MLQIILDSVNCQICLVTMTDPRTLPCGHVFCLQCINTLFENQLRPGRLTVALECPNRCGTHDMTQQAIDLLPKNFALNSIIEAISQTGVCQIHNEIMGFIDITNGDLLCATCVDTTLLAGAQSDSVSLDLASSDSAIIRSFAAADNFLKSNLVNLTARSRAGIAELNAECEDQINIEKKMREHAEQEICATFDILQKALDDQRERIQANLTKILSEIRIGPHSVSELRDYSQSLQNTTNQAIDLLSTRDSQTPQEAPISFFQSGVQLQAILERDLETTNDIIAEIESFHFYYGETHVSIKTPEVDAVLEAFSALELSTVEGPEMEESISLAD